jgi:hypothetical protein
MRSLYFAAPPWPIDCEVDGEGEKNPVKKNGGGADI